MDETRSGTETAPCGTEMVSVDARDLAWMVADGGQVWLLATLVGGTGDVFAVRELTGPYLEAFGGDVLVHLTPAGAVAGAGIRAEVWAVAAGSMYAVAAWDGIDGAAWVETVRPAAAFAMDAFTAIGAFADLGVHLPVPVGRRSWAEATGLPNLPWRGPARSGR